MDFELPTPDISWDLERLETTPPSELSQPPSPAVTPSLTPSPVTSSSAGPTIVAQLGTLTPSSTQAGLLDGSQPSISTSKDRTYYSCPPLWSETIDAQNERDAPEKITDTSTVRIAYFFRVQLLGDTDITLLLPTIESRFKNSLGEYLKNNTVYDEGGRCDGFYVDEDLRRRNLTSAGRGVKRRAADENSPTKIIGISSVADLFVDETQSCVPRNNDQCYIAHGELDATYVGFNEAGVKSSISRAVEKKLVDDSRYEIHYLGSQYQSDEGTASGPSAINGASVKMQEAASGEGFLPSPLGIGILAILGSTFLVVCYVLFIKSNGVAKVKNTVEQRKEKRDSKRNALCEEDDEKRIVDRDSCYDLQSITIDYDFENESEDGVEVFAPHPARSIPAVRHGTASTHDSDRTRKVSNGTDDSVVFTVANEDGDSSASQGSRNSISKNFLFADNNNNSSMLPSVDMLPSAYGNSKLTHRSSKSVEACAIQKLPSISESLSPPAYDTPHVSQRSAARNDASGRDGIADWEV